MTAAGIEAALGFLQASRSVFVRSAGAWLRDFDDPAPVLLNLAGPVSQTLGPWETFRHACLLGLFHASSVKALAEDVIAEPLDEDTPPVAAARAVAHAHDRFGLQPTAARHGALLGRLEHAPATAAPAEQAAVASAHWALSRALGDALSEHQKVACALLREADASTFGVPVAEAAVLTGAGADARRALDVAWSGQQDDGGLACGAKHDLLRGLYTLRAVALEKRLARG